MAPHPPDQQAAEHLDPWERHERVALRVIPYFSLGVAVLMALLTHREFPGSVPVTLGLAAFTAVWMLWLVTLRPGWEPRTWLVAVFYAGLLVLIAVLVARNPLFGFFAFNGYLFAGLLPKRWGVVGVLATALLMAGSQVGGFPWQRHGSWLAYLVVAAVNAVLASLFTYFSLVVQAQNRQRKEVIAQLTDTMRENDGLHAQLLASAREAGVLDERQRMAREIHDTLAQGLTGIITQLEAAGQAAGRPADWRRHLDTAAALARDSLAEARRSVRAMRPEPLEDARLQDALTEVAQRWSQVSGVPAEVVTTGTAAPMHPEIEVTLLRTAQEALANVAKHAGATRVGLTLSYMGDQLTLDVRDDGAGFEPAALPPPNGHGGYGLTAMRQRVTRLAGTLVVESEPGGGTAISASLPAVPEGCAGG
jgi:signal transduction histidine kinase